MKQKNKKDDFQECCLGSLLGNMLIGKGIVRASYGNKKGKGTVRAGYGNEKF